MARIITILIILALAAGYAHAIGVGGEGLRFGRVGATAGKATSAAPPVTPCSGTGLIFTSACNSQYIGIL